jgi:hypothetical protein
VKPSFLSEVDSIRQIANQAAYAKRLANEARTKGRDGTFADGMSEGFRLAAKLAWRNVMGRRRRER